MQRLLKIELTDSDKTYLKERCQSGVCNSQNGHECYLGLIFSKKFWKFLEFFSNYWKKKIFFQVWKRNRCVNLFVLFFFCSNYSYSPLTFIKTIHQNFFEKIKGYENQSYRSIGLTIRGEKIFVKHHCLSYWISKDFPSEFDLNLDISHLCHLRSCVKISHLHQESRSLNNSRKGCFSQRLCIGHESAPDCVFWDIFPSSYPTHSFQNVHLRSFWVFSDWDTLLIDWTLLTQLARFDVTAIVRNWRNFPFVSWLYPPTSKPTLIITLHHPIPNLNRWIFNS